MTFPGPTEKLKSFDRRQSADESGWPRGAEFPLPTEPDDRRASAVLRPVLWLAAFVVLACGWVSLRWPLKHLCYLLWLAAPFLLAGWLWFRRGLHLDRRAVLTLGLAGLSVWVVLTEVSGETSPLSAFSYHPDAWSYQAISNYLFHYPRGQGPEGLPLIEQFGSLGKESRFASCCVLAFLRSAPAALQPLTALPAAFYALCLAAHFCSMVFFVQGLTGRRVPALVAASLSTLSGWTCNAIIISNYDNLLFVAMLPAWLGVAMRAAEGWDPPGKSVLAGAILTAALFCVYPEGCALLSILAAPLAIHVLRRLWRRANGFAALAGWAGLSLVLGLPYLPIFLGFIRNQLGAATASARPGLDNFPGLLGAGFLPALFALGKELPGASFSVVNLLLPLLLFALVIAGFVRLAFRHAWFGWTALPVLALALWQGVWLKYDYGLFKVLFCGAPWIYAALVIGLDHLAGRVFNRRAGWALAFGAFLLAGLMRLERIEDRPHRVWPGRGQQGALRELPEIGHVIGHAPVLVDVDDEIDALWVTFSLRRNALSFLRLPSYLGMPHNQLPPVPPPEDCPYVLVSGEARDALWSNGRFALRLNQEGRFVEIHNPNGREVAAGGGAFFWVSGRETVFTIQAPQAGDYDLQATFSPGPSAPQSPVRTVEISDPAGFRLVVLEWASQPGNPPRSLRLRLVRGKNEVKLRCLEKATILVLPNGDARQLLLGMQDVRLLKSPPEKLEPQPSTR